MNYPTPRITRESILATASCNNRWIARLLASSAVLAVPAAMAQQTWDGSDSADWNTAANWNGNALPGGNATINAKNPAVPFTAAITADLAATPVDIFVGSGASTDGQVNHSAGTAGTGTNNWMFVGVTGGTGLYNIANTSATGGTYTALGQGSGSLNVGGSAAASGRLYVGGRESAGGGIGTVNIHTTGTVKIGNDLVVGASAGTGRVNMDSGTVTTNGWNFFGTQGATIGGAGHFRMSGGTFTNGTTNAAGCRTYVGLGDSTGTFLMTGGTYNNNKSGNDTQFAIGVNNLPNATTPTATISGGTLNAGRLLTVGGNAAFGGNGGSVGVGKGSLKVDGATAVVNATGEFWIGQAAGGIGTFDLSAGAVNSDNWVAIGREGSQGTVTLSGGTWKKTGAGSVTIGTGTGGIGTVTHSSGTFDIQTGDLLIGENSTGTGNYTLSGDALLKVDTGLVVVARDGSTTGNLTLNGGTLRANAIDGRAGAANVFFNGTEIIGLSNRVDFINDLDLAEIQAQGLRINTNGFNLTTPQAFSGGGSITKTGAGTLRLTGTGHTYTGDHFVQAGNLSIDAFAAAGTGGFTLADGTGLEVFLSLANDQRTANGLTLGNTGATSLTVSWGDMAGTTSTTPPLNVTGNLVRNGTTTVNVTGSRFAVGNLPLVRYDATKVSGTGNFVLGAVPNGVIATLQNNPNYFGPNQGAIYLQINSVALPKWTGQLVSRFTTGDLFAGNTLVTVANGTGILVGQVVSGDGIDPGTTVTAVTGNNVTLSAAPSLDIDDGNLMFVAGPGLAPGVWNTTTQNWVDLVNGSPSTYADPNPVLFDDDAPGSTTVTLNTVVNPSEVTVNNALKNYTFSGSGSISGTGTLIKRGSGELTLSTTNSYDGPTRLEGGITNVAVIANGGVASPIGDSPAAPGNLVIAGGLLNYTGTTPVTTDRGISFEAGGGGFAHAQNLTFTGQLQSAITGGSFRKEGAGTLAFKHLGANQLASGNQIINITAGTLALDGTGGTQTNAIGGELWVGTLPDVPANLTLTNTTLNVSSWIAVARGNGNDGVTNVSLTNSTVTSGNFSTGFANGETNNQSEANVSLQNSTWTTGAVANFSEGVGSTANLLIAGTSEMRTDRFLTALGDASVANVTIQDSGSLNKTGGSWMSIGNSGSGQAFVTVKNSGKLNNAAGDFNIGDTGTSKGTLTIQDNATVTNGGTFFLGKGNGTEGTLNISGGSFTSTGGVLMGGLGNDTDDSTAKGTVNQTGGTVTFNGDDNRVGCAGDAVWNISAGSVTSNGWFTLGRYALGSGVMNVSGGTVTQNHADRPLRVSELGQAELNISGGEVISAKAGGVSIAGPAGSSGIINLNTGGTLTVSRIIAGGVDGTSRVKLNGGTLKAATGANLDFIPAVLDNLLVSGDGAFIDTNGQTVAITQSIEDDGGDLTKRGAGTLQLNGANSYFGTTTVEAGALGGNGSLTGPLVVNATGTIAPGTAAGNFTVGDQTTINGTYKCEIDGATADRLTVTAGLVLGAGAVLDFDVLNTPTEAVYVIASYISLTGTFTVQDLPSGYTLQYGYNDGVSSNNIALVRTGGGESPYNSWAEGFGLNPLTDGAPGFDADKDGQVNSLEFALGGSPVSGSNNAKVFVMAQDSDDTDPQRDLLMTIAVRTGTGSFSGTPLTLTRDGYTYTIQGSSNLTDFTTRTAVEVGVVPPPAPNATAPSGYEWKTFKLVGSEGLPGRGFLRVMVTP